MSGVALSLAVSIAAEISYQLQEISISTTPAKCFLAFSGETVDTS
jgi:hypothetical protein